jgi:hypothetical protein
MVGRFAKVSSLLQKTSNIEHRTPNIEDDGRRELWALDIGCWMLDVSLSK